MSNETHSLFPFQKSEVVISGSVVLVVFFIGLIGLGQPLPQFRSPCDGFFFRIAPVIATISFLFAIYWATIGIIRFVGNKTFIVAGDIIHRSTHLAFLLPLLTILAILAGLDGFIVVGIICAVLLAVPYIVSQASSKTDTLIVVGNIAVSLIAFSLSIFLLGVAGGMCFIARF